MLSDDLKALTDHFAGYLPLARGIPPEEVYGLVTLLRDLERQADRVEAASITAVAKLSDQDLPDNVIRLPVARSRRVSASPAPEPPQCA
jgi:hypothetical protein